MDEHSSNMPVLLLRQAQHNMIQQTETALSRGWHPASLMEKGHGTIVAKQQKADALGTLGPMLEKDGPEAKVSLVLMSLWWS